MQMWYNYQNITFTQLHGQLLLQSENWEMYKPVHTLDVLLKYNVNHKNTLLCTCSL